MIRIEIEMSTTYADQVGKVMNELSATCASFADDGSVIHRITVEEADA